MLRRWEIKSTNTITEIPPTSVFYRIRKGKKTNQGETNYSLTRTQINNKLGSRIINVDKLQKYADDITKYSTQCGGTIILSSESRDGLASRSLLYLPTYNHPRNIHEIEGSLRVPLVKKCVCEKVCMWWWGVGGLVY